MNAHQAMLRAASWIVPRERRPDWLAEWRGELWQVQRSSARPTAFCAGAFSDALWIRLHTKIPRPFLESPARCLGVLFLAATIAVVALFSITPVTRRAATLRDFRKLRGTGTAFYQALGRHRVLATTNLITFRGARARFRIDEWSLDDAAIASLPDATRGFIVSRDPLPFLWREMLALTSIVLLIVLTTAPRELPRAPARFYCFLLAKIALLIVLVVAGMFAFTALIAPDGVQVHGSFIGLLVAFRWALADQRRRCPECLRLLAHPTRIGSTSQTFLEWYGTELACVRGHGLLYVPDSPALSYTATRWTRLDSSWAGLFSGIG